MKVMAVCGDKRIEIPCGSGKQHIRWLALVVATRMQREKYPHAFKVPQCVRNANHDILRPRQVIGEALHDGDEVIVELRHGATVSEEEAMDLDIIEWMDESFGPDSNLMECKFRFRPDTKQDFPKNVFVKGDFTVAPRWQLVYPQKDFGGPFEIEATPAEDGGGETQYEWMASRKGPPGSATYKFVLKYDNGHVTEGVCKGLPETLHPRDPTMHYTEFTWDVPIAPEPYPEIDSRPSTASSRDGAQVDPRFEQDWEAMRLKWIESFMKVRVKDVLTEFYAILIDLFDSYAFMGLDLSASQHTIGMDDWKHLLINCGLLNGQPEGVLDWREACTWFEEAAGVRDGRPYLEQRLTRAHYLELLMRAAGYCMCENPRAKHKPDAGRPPMPLDEGLFRFITDILIPVMDVYDDDQIRKDAVQHQNLIVIQQHRQSIRSIYTFLSKPWPPADGEKIVVPMVFRFLFDFTMEKLEDPEGGGAAAAAAAAAAGGDDKGEEAAAAVDFTAELSGDGKLSVDQLRAVLEAFDEAVDKVTEQHPEEIEHRSLFFWEFFEVLMHCSRAIFQRVGTPLHEGLPCVVNTCLAVMSLVDQDIVVLPVPELDEELEGSPEPSEGGD